MTEFIQYSPGRHIKIPITPVDEFHNAIVVYNDAYLAFIQRQLFQTGFYLFYSKISDGRRYKNRRQVISPAYLQKFPYLFRSGNPVFTEFISKI